MSGRVIALWLDGLDMVLADSYQLQVLTRLRSTGVVAALDGGTAYRTGLTGEHLSTGFDPEAAKRFSAVRFDPNTYRCVQQGTRAEPIFGDVRTVAFDMSYFDLDRARDNVVGVSDWGVHDPGGSPQARPATLTAELEERFGPYPARRWIYGVPWASPRACVEMGRDLVRAVDVRSRIATWLLAKRFTDWKLALVGFSEAHSGSEGLFHGVESDHPWTRLASAPEAGVALRSVYTAIDRAVGEIVDAFPDDTVVVFSMHGMGPNDSDVPSMALLGEVMARWSGAPATSTSDFRLDANGVPVLPERMGWTAAVLPALNGDSPSRMGSVVHAITRGVPQRLRTAVTRVTSGRPAIRKKSEGTMRWMPLMRHQGRWPHMKAFAIPSFYDGRIRVNLIGRESNGLVSIEEYDSFLTEIEELLRSCRESRTGRPVVRSIERVAGNPFERGDDDVDVVVLWADDVLGISHPDLGVIGPLPPRRTGGHASPIGRCMIVGPNVRPAEIGVRSSFDIVPTLLSLVGSTPVESISGRPILESCR